MGKVKFLQSDVPLVFQSRDSTSMWICWILLSHERQQPICAERSCYHPVFNLLRASLLQQVEDLLSDTIFSVFASIHTDKTHFNPTCGASPNQINRHQHQQNKIVWKRVIAIPNVKVLQLLTRLPAAQSRRLLRRASPEEIDRYSQVNRAKGTEDSKPKPSTTKAVHNTNSKHLQKWNHSFTFENSFNFHANTMCVDMSKRQKLDCLFCLFFTTLEKGSLLKHLQTVIHNKKLVKASDAIFAWHEKLNEKERALEEQISKTDFGDP
jgi:hypothetical protein